MKIADRVCAIALGLAAASGFFEAVRAQSLTQSAPAPNARADTRGMVAVQPYTASVSEYLSPEARRQFAIEANRPQISAWEGLAAQRRAYDEVYIAPRRKRALELYPSDVRPQVIGGVQTVVVTPKSGVSPANRDRVLINLHAGAFVYGQAATVGVTEAAPIAGVGRIKVVSVDYRQGPEHKFPVALQDIAAVYRELLKTYRPGNIGIYGCSSGGQLSGMAVAWFQREKLPRPGAIGVFCAGIDAVMGGDARFISFPLMGRTAPRPSDPDAAPMPAPDYFGGADRSDPLVFPSYAPAVLAGFPPTLFITASRDFAASAAFNSHARLVKAGVEADLHVWDGLWHGFVNDVDLPESRDAFAVAAKFFERHLGRRR